MVRDTHARVNHSVLSDSDDSSDEEPEQNEKTFLEWAKSWKAFTSLKAISGLLLLAWVALGFYIYRTRNWSGLGRPYTFAEIIYLMAQILTTVGYGDYTPVDFNGRMYTAAYVLFGTLVLSSMVGTLTNTIGNQLAKEDTQRQLHNSGETMLTLEFWNFLRSGALWLFFVAGGTLFWWFFEAYTLDEAFYCSVITLTTIGFGDFTSKTEHGKIFAAFWMLFGVASFANMVGRFSAWFSDLKGIKKLSKNKLSRMFENTIINKCVQEVHGGEKRMSRGEYILFMVSEMKLCDANLIDQLSANFDKIDKDRSGYLDEKDILEYESDGSKEQIPHMSEESSS